MSHGSVAASVRREKAEHPEMFCTVPGCLWRVKHYPHTGLADTPCRKHPTPHRMSLSDLATACRTFTLSEMQQVAQQRDEAKAYAALNAETIVAQQLALREAESEIARLKARLEKYEAAS